MKCPDCRRELPEIATACRCGWVSEPVVAGVVKRKCARCEETATVSENGEALCETHYVANATARARAFTSDMGLARREDESQSAYRMRLMSWVRENAKRAYKRMPHEG